MLRASDHSCLLQSIPELLGGFKLLSEGELGSVFRVWVQISACIRKGMGWDESLKA